MQPSEMRLSSIVGVAKRSAPEAPLDRIARDHAMHRNGSVVVHPLRVFALCSAATRSDEAPRRRGALSRRSFAIGLVPMPGTESSPGAEPSNTALGAALPVQGGARVAPSSARPCRRGPPTRR